MKLQFGDRQEGQTYRTRKAAFAVVERGGLIAVASIRRPGGGPTLELPGGGVDPGESETDALIREFAEEVGLKIAARRLLVRAGQYMINAQGEAVNNESAFFEGALVAETPQAQIEDDHDLVWIAPEDFIVRARHEAQAWAVCVWLRRRS